MRPFHLLSSFSSVTLKIVIPSLGGLFRSMGGGASTVDTSNSGKSKKFPQPVKDGNGVVFAVGNFLVHAFFFFPTS